MRTCSLIPSTSLAAQGISLNPEQFETLVNAAADISTAADSKDYSYCAQLGSK